MKVPSLRVAGCIAVAAVTAIGPATTKARIAALSCAFADGEVTVEFSIDHAQFAPALDPNDPPRRKVTRVRLGTQSFVAEPILMTGGVRGFWTDDPVTGTHVLTAQQDGSAVYSGPARGRLDGTCEEIG